MIWVIFGINTTSDISKLLYEISRAQPRPQGFSLKKWVGWEKGAFSRPTHFLREKPFSLIEVVHEPLG